MQLCSILASPNQCVDPGCGNGVVEMGEGCDDGNTNTNDGCNNACLLELGQGCTLDNTCASGFCDPDGNTCACNEAADCPMGQVCNAMASPNACVDPNCGNSIVDPGEACDDGNMATGDGCGATCLLELGQTCNATSNSCESGFCDPATDVCACDGDADCPAGNVCNTTPDPNACVAAGCGNAVLEANEGCDDGNTSPGDGCSEKCTKELGQTCNDGTECGSGNCDGTVNKCVCDKDIDCPMSQVCDTNANPHACIVPPMMGCKADTDCMGGLVCDQSNGMCVECTTDTDCQAGVCNELSNTCVECTNDSECANGGTCVAETHTCKSGGVVVEGGGILCTASSTSTSSDSLPFGLLGLLGLGALRRRRR
jgi:MYXO-CTERM domain-containing protein